MEIKVQYLEVQAYAPWANASLWAILLTVIDSTDFYKDLGITRLLITTLVQIFPPYIPTQILPLQGDISSNFKYHSRLNCRSKYIYFNRLTNDWNALPSCISS